MENVNRRLELIKMMRHEHNDNILRIQRREQILYPNRKPSYYDSSENRNEYRKTTPYNAEYKDGARIDQAGQHLNYSFYFRLGISIGLFLLCFYMKKNNISYFGITYDMVQNLISDTFEWKSFAFMK